MTIDLGVILCATRGWAVLPLHTVRDGRCSCGGVNPKCKPGKHPIAALVPHGLKDATCDPVRLAAWWAQVPDANVGIATGAVSGLVVLDVDPGHGGEDTLHDLEIQHGELPETAEAITGGGGRHIYFRHPGTAVPNSAGTRLGAGLDIRGDGGYVVAPPSTHVSGNRYEWEVSHHPDSTLLADMPQWLLSLAVGPTPSQNGYDPTATTMPSGLYLSKAATFFVAHGAPIGSQRETALRAGRSYLGAGYSVQETAEALWRGLQVSPVGDPSRPWIYQDALDIAADLAAHPGPPPAPLSKPRFAQAGQLHRTDLGNARRLIEQHGEDLRYSHLARTWYVWDGRRWLPDATAEVTRRAKRVVAQIGAEAAQIQDPDERKTMLKHALASEEARRIKNMIAMGESEPGVPVTPAELDRNPWLLNCINGTVDLRTGQLQPHERGCLITRLAPVAYDMIARLPLWHRFLEEATGHDKELETFLQRAVGYSLTGHTTEEVLFFVHGPAAAGKSTFLETLKNALGDYAVTADFETFVSRRDVGSPRPDIARLAGSRFVVSIEVDQGKRLAEGLVKMLTGGDTVTARHLYQSAFEFVPAFKLWLAANHAPGISDEDEAMWRRVLRVPFERVVPQEQRDPMLKTTLRDVNIAGPAVLAWAVQGCLDWQQHGLQIPTVIRRATRQLRLQMDPLREFIDECCVLDAQAFASSTDLREMYEKWGKEQGDTKLLKGKRWGEKLRAYGCSNDKTTGGIRIWRGIRLLTADEKPVPSLRDDPFGVSGANSGASGAIWAFSGKPYKETRQEKRLEKAQNAPLAPLFEATADWQDLPEGAVTQPGYEYKLNMTTGRRQVRLDPRLNNPWDEPEPDYVYDTEEPD